MNDQALIPLPISSFLSAFREAAKEVFYHKSNLFPPSSYCPPRFVVDISFRIFAEHFLDTRRNPFGIGSRMCRYYGTLYTLEKGKWQDHWAWEQYEAGIKKLLAWALELELAEMGEK